MLSNIERLICLQISPFVLFLPWTKIIHHLWPYLQSPSLWASPRWDGAQHWFQTYRDRNTLKYWAEAGWNLVQTNQGWVEIFRQEKKGQGFKLWRITWTKLHVHKVGTHLSNLVSLPSFSSLISHTNQLSSLNSLKHLPCFSLTLRKFEVFPFYHILGLGPR